MDDWLPLLFREQVREEPVRGEHASRAKAAILSEGAAPQNWGHSEEGLGWGGLEPRAGQSLMV